MLLLDFLRDYYVPLRLLGRSARTVELYEYSVRLFGLYLARPPTLDDLQDLVVARYLSTLLDGIRSPYSVRKERDQILAIWRLAARKRLVEYWPDVPQIVVPELSPHSYSQSDLSRLWQSCATERGTIAGVDAGQWWTALHHVLLDTAERIAAVLACEFGDIRGNVITFRASTRKGRQRANVKMLRPKTMQAIDAIRLPARDIIFPWDRSPTLIYRHYARIRRRAGVSSPRAFHTLRVTHASHVEAAGGSAQDSLGHSSAETTRRHYLDRAMTSEVDFGKYLPDVG